MKPISRKRPQLGFKGFDENWEKKRLGEISKLTGRIGFRGYTKKDIIKKEDGGVLALSPTDISDNYLRKTTKSTYITKEKYNESPEIMVKNGDILFAKTGSLGKSALVENLNENATVNPQIVVIKIKKDYCKRFISSYLISNYVLKQIAQKKIGGVVPTLTEAEINKFQISIPWYEEQQKIGTFFKQLDELITLCQHQLDQLKALKKGYLQKMFPQNSAKVPELRFKGFADDWEQRKLSAFVQRRSKSSEDRNLPSVEYEDITSGTGILNKDIWDKNVHKKGILFLPGDTLFGKLRPYLDNRLFPSFEGLAVGDFWVLCPIDIEPAFLFILIQSETFRTVANQSSGTKMPRSDWKKVSNTRFYIPKSRQEQQKIGAFFKQLDNFITLNQHKLDKLKELKKAYLQKMFC